MRRGLAHLLGSVALVGLSLLTLYKVAGCESPLDAVQGTFAVPVTLLLATLGYARPGCAAVSEGAGAAAGAILLLALGNEALIRLGLAAPADTWPNALLNLVTLTAAILVAAGAYRLLLGPAPPRDRVMVLALTVWIAALQRLETGPEVPVFRLDNGLVLLPLCLLLAADARRLGGWGQPRRASGTRAGAAAVGTPRPGHGPALHYCLSRPRSLP